MLNSPHISLEVKEELTRQYEKLNPVSLMQSLKERQNRFWEFSWKASLSVTEKEDNTNQSFQACVTSPKAAREYRRTVKPRKPQGIRTWRTRKDPFEDTWKELEIRLSMDRYCTAKQLLKQLIEKNPTAYSYKHLRTLQRRILKWRIEQENKQQQVHFLLLAGEAANT